MHSVGPLSREAKPTTSITASQYLHMGLQHMTKHSCQWQWRQYQARTRQGTQSRANQSSHQKGDRSKVTVTAQQVPFAAAREHAPRLTARHWQSKNGTRISRASANFFLSYWMMAREQTMQPTARTIKILNISVRISSRMCSSCRTCNMSPRACPLESPMAA